MSMANGKTRLELTWIGKENRPKLEPRILLEDPSKSYHASARRGKNDLFDNRLIFGDNLLALKALESEFAGKIKCICIDPPYNTGSAFEQYDDGIEHSLWLSLMRDRFEILRRMLTPDGSLWVALDDNEAHYAKVMLDELFGRGNFVANAVWQKKYTIANDAKWLSENHDHILVYALDKQRWRPYRLERSAAMNERYGNPDNHPKGPWKATPLYAKRTGTEKEQAFTYIFKNGVEWSPPRGSSPRFSEDKLREMDANDEIWFGVDGTATPSRKTFLDDLKVEGTPAPTIWLHSEAGNNHEAREEVKAIGAAVPFATPKPEKLIKRILELATVPGDLVLDSFAGSGTTGAVAHKMGRRWIMVELGEHCHTHIIPRLQRVIDGKDPGGVTEAAGWKGGGGFRYYRLAPSLLKKDKWKQWIINPEYNAEMLAAALCKVEGFRYEPSTTVYWQHGYSTENDFIYVTTQTLTKDMLRKLSDEVGPRRSLLVLCKAFRASIGKGEFPNLTIKKIPKAVLAKCEWDRDDYSLEIKALPKAPPEPEPDEPPSNGARSSPGGGVPKSVRRRAAAAVQGDLFMKGGN